MLGIVLLGIGLLLILGPFGIVGLIEWSYRRRRARRERECAQLERQLNGHLGTQLDFRERRRIVQRELDRLRR